MAVLTSFLEILVGGITTIAKGIGGGLSQLVSYLFVGNGSTLTVFGTVVAIFAGISLAIGLCRWVLNFITSLGARNR